MFGWESYLRIELNGKGPAGSRQSSRLVKPQCQRGGTLGILESEDLSTLQVMEGLRCPLVCIDRLKIRRNVRGQGTLATELLRVC